MRRFFHHFFFFGNADHPIHVPVSDKNPWHADFYSSKGYIVKANKGVFQVYENEEALKKNTPKDYPYPLLDTYISDLNKICTMMADGPLWVQYKVLHEGAILVAVVARNKYYVEWWPILKF